MNHHAHRRTMFAFVLSTILCVGGGVTRGQDESAGRVEAPDAVPGTGTPATAAWSEALGELEQLRAWNQLRRQISVGPDQQQRLADGLVRIIEDNAPPAPWTGPEVWADMNAAFTVELARRLARVPEWALLDAAVRRLDAGANRDLLRGVLIGAGAFEITPLRNGVFHHYPHISDYLERFEAAPTSLPHPLVGWMMEYDPHTAIATLT